MSETSEIRRPDRVAFVAAWIVASVVTTAMNYWGGVIVATLFWPEGGFTLISVLLVGAPLSFVLGAVFLFALGRKGPLTLTTCLKASLFSVVVVVGAQTVIAAVSDELAGSDRTMLLGYTAFVGISVTVWALIFALLYNAFCRNPEGC
jgi:hypothetical protein